MINESYPDTVPNFQIKKESGLNDAQISSLQILVSEKAKQHMGQEMIFEVANAVQDSISDHNSFIYSKDSAHELMKRRKAIDVKNDTKIKGEQSELESIRLKIQQEARTTALKKMIEQEIKEKVARLSASEVNNIPEPKPSTLTLENVIICPHSKCSNPNLKDAWFKDCANSLIEYSCKIHGDELHLQIENGLEMAKSMKHTSLATLHDYKVNQVKHVYDIRILLDNRHQVSLPSLMRTSGSISIKQAHSILNEFLSFVEEICSMGLTLNGRSSLNIRYKLRSYLV